MARRSQGINPFYPLVVIAGVAFVITACAYGVMALNAMSPQGAGAGHPLLAFLDKHGVQLLGIELGALAAASALAMGTDQYWTRRGKDLSVDANPAGGHIQPAPSERSDSNSPH